MSAEQVAADYRRMAISADQHLRPEWAAHWRAKAAAIEAGAPVRLTKAQRAAAYRVRDRAMADWVRDTGPDLDQPPPRQRALIGKPRVLADLPAFSTAIHTGFPTGK